MVSLLRGPWLGKLLLYLDSPGATDCIHQKKKKKWPRSQLVTKPQSFPTGQILEELQPDFSARRVHRALSVPGQQP